MSTNLLFELITSTLETVTMVFTAGLFATLIGLPVGIFLYSTRQANLFTNPLLHKSIAMLVNMLRSIPFIILLVAIIPVTRFIVGTSIGTTAAIVPLTLAAIPFVARLIENNLKQLPPGLIETGLAIGASNLQLIRAILLSEALPGIVGTITTTLITLIAYSAMAGAVGGGGLGDLAIRYGYQRFDIKVMLATILILIALVQAIQHLGDYLVRRLTHA